MPTADHLRRRFPNKPAHRYNSYQRVYEDYFYNDIVQTYPELTGLSLDEVLRTKSDMIDLTKIQAKFIELNQHYKQAMISYKECFPSEAALYEDYLYRKNIKHNATRRVKKAAEKKSSQVNTSSSVTEPVSNVHFEELANANTNSDDESCHLDDKIATSTESTEINTKKNSKKRYKKIIKNTIILVKRLKLNKEDEYLILNSLES